MTYICFTVLLVFRAQVVSTVIPLYILLLNADDIFVHAELPEMADSGGSCYDEPARLALPMHPCQSIWKNMYT